MDTYLSKEFISLIKHNYSFCVTITYVLFEFDHLLIVQFCYQVNSLSDSQNFKHLLITMY